MVIFTRPEVSVGVRIHRKDDDGDMLPSMAWCVFNASTVFWLWRWDGGRINTHTYVYICNTTANIRVHIVHTLMYRDVYSPSPSPSGITCQSSFGGVLAPSLSWHSPGAPQSAFYRWIAHRLRFQNGNICTAVLPTSPFPSYLSFHT